MKIAIVATYPPRSCGIGTFTENLVKSLRQTTDSPDDIIVIAMNDNVGTYDYPPEVKLSIRQEQQTDYLEAADFINRSGADICILEHEFGIFGGRSGVYILPLLHRLNIPIIATLHTILKEPSYTEKAILSQICKMADQLVVMSHKAVAFLQDIYKVAPRKIKLIEHGVPDIQCDRVAAREELRLNGKTVLLTFGFIGRNKGIETAISALPQVIKKHPELLYIVLGQTHPNVLHASGEEYRNQLKLQIKQLQLQDNVLLINEFADELQLFKYLAACDIYITPYTNEAQITSGTLTYAMGAGCVVVSTPYWHAAELLADGRGCLFDFRDDKALAKVLNKLLDSPKLMKDIQQKAVAYGKTIIWPKIGQKYYELAQGLQNKRPKAKIAPHPIHSLDPLYLPPFSLAHIHRMTDDTGIIQHATFGIPNLKEGYCLDDNARALLMVCMAYKQKKDAYALALMPVFLSYINYMQLPNGRFRNFLSFSRQYLDDGGSEDSFGRTIWVLGYLMGNAPNDAYYQTARQIFFDAAPNFDQLRSIRGIANTMIGICYYLRSNPGDAEVKATLLQMTNSLVQHFEQNQTKDWHWFESLLAYDNGIMPLALLHAAQILENKKAKNVAFKAMEFLGSQTLKDGYLSVIGNREWFKKDETRSIYSQQPIDAMAMVLMYHQAFVLSGNTEYLDKLFTSFMWFLGENDLRLSLFDYETNGCCDGFDDYGVNRNQGAESTLAYIISHLTVLQAYEETYHPKELATAGSRSKARKAN